MARIVGRDDLLEEVRALLATDRPVALHGVTGVGKSALLDAIAQGLIDRGAREHHTVDVIRCTGAAEETALPLSAVRDLVAQCPPELVAAAPPPVRDAIEAGLVGLEPTDELRADLAAGLHAIWDTWSREGRLVLLLDDVQWLDPASSAIVGHARRRLDRRVAAVATVGPGALRVGERDAATGWSGGAAAYDVDLSGFAHLEVPPLDEVAMVELLCGGCGPGATVSPQVARGVHRDSGGIPATALVLAGAAGPRPTLLGERTPLPTSLVRVLRERHRSQPAAVQETLLHVALSHRPTVRGLIRAGRTGAEEEVRRARHCGLLAIDGEAGGLRFTPAALREVILSGTPAQERAALHEQLATAATSIGQRLRHEALASIGPDPDAAVALGSAAAATAAQGQRELAAELYLLAAEAAPLGMADRRTEWLVAVVETAAPGNHVDLVRRALADFAEVRASADQTVRVRLAMSELAGAAVTTLDEVVASALVDAGDNPGLVAQVLLQRARISMMGARPHDAARSAARAVGLLEGGDERELATGLTTLAVAQRWIGGPYDSTLARALELAGPGPVETVHTSPGYLAARFAFYDDRLDQAWSEFTTMLARLPRGAGADEVHVLRCLVEVAVRTGRCREAMDYAARATRLGDQLGLDGHTAWFIDAQAELVGGDLDRARVLARSGAEAAVERGDRRYLQRHLIVLGQALLRSGDARGAVVALERVRDLEQAGRYDDPTVNRWQADLVGALVLLGRLEEAADVLGRARAAADARGEARTIGVRAQLDRSEAELALALGDLDVAERLVSAAGGAARRTGLRIEEGRVLILRSRIERRRRRASASRATLAQASAHFEALHALAWVTQLRAEQSPESSPVADHPLLETLTDTEAKVARAVASGATNREIAERTFVSVKTVEATLTRVYRKLDIHSRTRLATLLAPGRETEPPG